MTTFPSVMIDPTANNQKYILVEVSNKDGEIMIVLRAVVEGRTGIAHRTVLGRLHEELKGRGLLIKCLGGGKLKLDYDAKTILIHGFSSSYGRADDQKVQKVLTEEFPEYKITMGI